MEADLGNWRKAFWWKLHLRPGHLKKIDDLQLPPLPPNVTLDKVYTDFLRFVNEQVQSAIEKKYGVGVQLWQTLASSAHYIFATPNGWEGSQQSFMRQAAVGAGLISPEAGRQVQFVTEAEASIMYAAQTGVAGDWLQAGSKVIVADCGGGTVDITGFLIKQIHPLRLEEASPPQCFFAGGVHIKIAAENYFRRKFSGTQWSQFTQEVVDFFDCSTKKKFDDPTKAAYPIRISSDPRKRDPALGIERNNVMVSGSDIATFFQPSIDKILEGLDAAYYEYGNKAIRDVILTGGLANSPFVYAAVLRWAEGRGVAVCRPDGPISKAVSNGALAWWCLDASVTSHIAKYHIGTDISVPFDNLDPDRRSRKVLYDCLTGENYVEHKWSEIIAKNCRTPSNKEFVEPYKINLTKKDSKIHVSQVYLFRGDIVPAFITIPSNDQKTVPGFERLCTVEADLKKLWDESPVLVSPETGEEYRQLVFKVCINIATPDITARISFVKGRKTRYGPAVIAFD
ncbi:hypothetical protein HGRIS_010964 [Hohenbuehelia grisea]|uniref:Actin-like ATPase domain-containing protein n=1 Tax=Hohenbuehelia grisea TaxID=104357 RepID=A0ABR3IYD9_9AGAR